MVVCVAPSARAFAIAALAVSIKLSFGSELCFNDDDSSLHLLQRTKASLRDGWNSKSKLVFIKTHFTGSTTLAGICQRVCDGHNATCARRMLHGYKGGTLKREELNDFVESYPDKDKLDIWPWHVEYDRAAFQKLIPGALTATLFREPISRFVSGMSHENANMTRQSLLLNALKKNQTIPYDVACVLPISKQVPSLSDVDLVMLTEDYDRSLVLLARKLGWPLESLLYTVERASPVSDRFQKHQVDEYKHFVAQPLENMTETGRTYMKTCVQPEREMYDRAKKIFQKQLDRLSQRGYEKLESDVARLQSALRVLDECCNNTPSDAFCNYTTERPGQWHVRTEHGRPPPPGHEVAYCRQRALSALNYTLRI